MKRGLAFIFFLFISPAAFAQLSNGLVAHWNFNGNANDVSGNGLNGVVNGATLTTGYGGTANTAYYFNGGSYITVPYNSLMNAEVHSICAVVKPTGFYMGNCHGNAILWRGDEGNGSFSYHLEYNNNAYDSNNCGMYDPTHELFMGGTGGGFSTTYVSNWLYSGFIDSNQWYCVVDTYDGDTERIYVDGVLKISTYEQPLFNNTTDSINIGLSEDNSSYPYWLTGVIDDIRFYNRALADSEVTQYCDSVESAIVQIDTAVTIDSVSNAVLCAGSNFNVFYSVNYSFQPSNIFTVQLSNSSGSFSSPVAIGSVTASIAGIIACTIPMGTATGTGYEIRIVASNPADTSANPGIIISTGSLAPPTAGNNSPLCAGETLQLNGNSNITGVTYSWTGPGNFTSSFQNPTIANATASAAGTYTLTISSMGCTNSSNTTVIIYPNEIPSFIISGNPCVGAPFNIIANNTSYNPAYYNWNFGAADIHSGSGAGTYSVSWSESGNESVILAYTGNCQPADTQNIVIYPQPVDRIIASNLNICSGDTITLQPQADSLVYTYKWAAATANIANSNTAVTSATFTGPGNIYMYISNQYGCTTTDSLYINAEPCCNIFVPNAFTPNGDNKNDVFRARSVRPFESYQIIIFNRWGQEVFTTKDENEGWDGVFNGTKQDIGVYFYYIKYICGGKELTKKGDATLLR